MTGWDESEHPRVPRGSEHGGEFTHRWALAVASRMGPHGLPNNAEGRRYLAQLMQQTPESGHIFEGQGQLSTVSVLTYPNGEKVIRKDYTHPAEPMYGEEDDEDWAPAVDDPERIARVEYVASLVAEEIGAPVPPVAFDFREDGVIHMAYVEGGDTTTGLEEHDPAILRTDDGVRLGLLDLLIGNSDRTPANYLVVDGRPIGIDHGNSDWIGEEEIAPNLDRFLNTLYESGEFVAANFMQWRQDPNGPPGKLKLVLVDNRLHRDDIAAVRIRMEGMYLRGEVTENHYDYMLMVLEQLEPHAKGDRRLIP